MFSKPLNLLVITAPKVKPPAKPRANIHVLSSFWPKKIMRRTIDSPDTSAHCLRHTLKINEQNAGVSLLTIAPIVGWADPQRRVSKHLLNYGSTGVSQSAMVIKLRDESRLMHKELIELEVLEQQKAKSNVVAFG